jgi:hypothetical protein
VDLDRLQGEDAAGSRYTDAHFLGLLAGEPVACARVSWDRCDRRARILSLHSSVAGAQPVLLSRVCDWLECESATDPLSVVVDVRADQPALLTTIEELGFFPTLYYPSLIASEDGRIDVLQYTRLSRQSIEEALQYVAKLDWPAARRAVDTVAALARQSEREKDSTRAAGMRQRAPFRSPASMRRT